MVDAGYGFGLGAERGVLTPYAGMTFGQSSSRTMKGGMRWELGPDAVLGLEATRRSAESAEATHELRVRAALRF